MDHMSVMDIYKVFVKDMSNISVMNMNNISVMDMDNISSTQVPTNTTIDFEEEINNASELHWWYPYILLAFYIVVFIAIPGNVLTIKAYLKFDSLKTCTNLVIANQSFADTVFLVLGQPFLWASYTEWAMDALSKSKYGCLVVLGMVTGSHVGSMANLMVLATERLLAVCFALRYYTIVTEKRLKRLIKGIWAVMILVAVIPMFGVNTWVPGRQCKTIAIYPSLYTTLVLVVPMVVSLLLTAIFNIIIAVIAFKKNKITPPVVPAPSSSSQNPAPRPDPGYKITKMLLMVVGLFYVCWLPVTILGMMHMNALKKYNGKPPESLVLAHEVARVFGAVYMAANPFIYGFRNEGFQRAFRKLLRMKLPAQVDPYGGVPLGQIKSRSGIPPAQVKPQPNVPQAQANPQHGIPQGQANPQHSIPQAQANPQHSIPQAQANPQPGIPQGQANPQHSIPQAQANPQHSIPQEVCDIPLIEENTQASVPPGQVNSGDDVPPAQVSPKRSIREAWV